MLGMLPDTCISSRNTSVIVSVQSGPFKGVLFVVCDNSSDTRVIVVSFVVCFLCPGADDRLAQRVCSPSFPRIVCVLQREAAPGLRQRLQIQPLQMLLRDPGRQAAQSAALPARRPRALRLVGALRSLRDLSVCLFDGSHAASSASPSSSLDWGCASLPPAAFRPSRSTIRPTSRSPPFPPRLQPSQLQRLLLL